jgi:hypothetical protein
MSTSAVKPSLAASHATARRTPPLSRDGQVKFWQYHLNLLPHVYTGLDQSRMTVLYFALRSVVRLILSFVVSFVLRLLRPHPMLFISL